MSERSGLERFSKHTPHRLRRLTLCCAGDMGVGVQGKACGEVTQHSGHGLHIYPVLQCQGGEGMAQVRKLFITTKTKRKKKPGSYRKTKTL